MHVSKGHYLPLDSVRGIAALSVVFHHFVISRTFNLTFPHAAWVDVPFFHNAWIFVDLFFVLSGMVIALNYANGGLDSFSFREFVIRRLARIYPLHIVMLLAALLFRMAKIAIVAAGFVHFAPSEAEVNNAYSFVVNVLLLHALGFIDYLSWNAPSWSISAEFYTYLLFGMVVETARRLASRSAFYALSFLASACGLGLIVVVLGKTSSLDFTHDFGILRCIYSFFIGAIAIGIATSRTIGGRTIAREIVQYASMAASLAIVCVVGIWPQLSFIAPFVFALLLGSLVAFPDCTMPKLLSVRPLVWLGKRSYSIYMVHSLLLVLLEYAIRAIGMPRIRIVDQFLPGLSATLTLAVLTIAVLVLANLTFNRVEGPGSRLVRKLLDRRPAGRTLVAEGEASRP